ncbi:acetate--CoA ligase family protein [Pseudonocardia hispaniensis]|uniref:Acetate--CoA ligase family protein n=1 Tax=Pseudonocardia hispaniensis TaxID=904933 RepID=A0ABW1J164_9PSEU
MGDLTPLFQPESAAVYGASSGPSRKLGNTLLSNVAVSLPDVRCVHPTAESIDGFPATATLKSPVDLALISVPARAAESAVLDAVTAGARALVVLSSGFAEAGLEGRAVQERIVDIARQHEVPLIGPNCMGVVSQLSGDRCLNASYFWEVPTGPGRLSFVSQSGAFGGMFLSFLGAKNLGLARFVSLGNAPDVTVTDALRWLGDDDRTEVIGVFAEGIPNGRAFVEVAGDVTSRKPVVILKGGRSQAGARAAAGHTGSLAGDHRIYEAAFRRAGVLQVDSSVQFFDTLRSLSVVRRGLTAGRVAVVTVSGGPGVLAADAADRSGLTLPTLTQQTQDRLRWLVPEFAAIGNPIDLTPQCRPEAMVDAVLAVYESREVDGVVVINCGLDITEFGAAVADAVRRTGVPTTAFLLDVPKVIAEVSAVGVPCFDSPEAAVHGIAVAIVDRRGDSNSEMRRNR